jgi:hypothetical protein
MSEVAEKLKSETALVNLDGFDGYTDESEAPDQEDFAPSARVIQGDRISFSKQGIWVDRAKQPLPSNLLLLVHDVIRVVQKWGIDGMPADLPRILGSNEKWPDVEAMNEKCPKSEWRMYFNQLIGPYQRQKVVYLWDPTITMNKYTWATSSNSGMACVSDLVEKIQMMRQFKKVKAYPIVTLGSLLWSKRYNTQGPNLIIQSWIKKDDSGALLPITATTSAAALTGPKPATVQETLDQSAGVKWVDPPTGKEATDDEIRF